MQDGYLYSDILLKLYLRSLKNEGKLMFKDVIPYTPAVLAQVVRHQVGTVEKAIKTFKDLGLIEILDNGAIYMTDIQNFIGQSSTDGDRKRIYRNRIKEEKLALGQMGGQMSDIQPPEIEIDIEKEIEQEIELDIDIDNNERIVTESSTNRQNKNQMHQEIINIYNSYCTNLPKIQKLTDKRKTAVNKLLKEFTIEQFEQICINANNSDFLTGHNDRGWKADFDFIIKPDKAVKILEGQYNNKKASKMDDFKRMWEEAREEDEQAGNSTNNNTFGW